MGAKRPFDADHLANWGFRVARTAANRCGARRCRGEHQRALSCPRGPSPATSSPFGGRKEGKRRERKARATTQKEPVNGLVVTPAPHPTLPSHPTPNPHPQFEPPPERPDRRLRRSRRRRRHLRHGADHHPREDRVSRSAGAGSGAEVPGACGRGEPGACYPSSSPSPACGAFPPSRRPRPQEPTPPHPVPLPPTRSNLTPPSGSRWVCPAPRPVAGQWRGVPGFLPPNRGAA
ncbi:hypothetical protein P7K49_011523 [Saguinus oedipus]|uniref:Uncharacterized protein n=1 Tax=Saguinus oedipus TaxID=9490 RepID=A0ABQ9VR76_SAGOE|nr:hypothetical protein P7K49_011523 [Saguinus oedipus]